MYKDRAERVECSLVILQYFSRKGVPEMVTAAELFKSITGCDFEDKIALLALQESFKMKPHLVDKPGIESNYNFEMAWEKCKTDAVKAEGEGMHTNILLDPLQT